MEYGSDARVAPEPASIGGKSWILHAINSPEPSCATSSGAGILLGYKLARQALIAEGINSVIILSAGMAGSGMTCADEIPSRLTDRKKEGITISTIGFGMGKYNDILMEQLTNRGDRSYYYTGRQDQARRLFQTGLTGTLEAITTDMEVEELRSLAGTAETLDRWNGKPAKETDWTGGAPPGNEG